MCACRQQRKSFLIEDILGDACGGRGAAAGAGGETQQHRRHPLCPQPLRPHPAPCCPQQRQLAPLYAPPCARAALLTYSLDAAAVHASTRWWHGVVSGAAAAAAARRAGGQVRFTAAQSSALERRFAAARYLSPEQRRRLAGELGLSDRQVKTWFQNRRAKWRRASSAAGDTQPRHDDDTTCRPHDPAAPHDAAPPPPPARPAHPAPSDLRLSTTRMLA